MATLGKKKISCPLCGNAPIGFYELSVVENVFDQINGFAADEGNASAPIGFIGVDAECGCGHRWRLRGVKGIEAVQRPKGGPA